MVWPSIWPIEPARPRAPASVTIWAAFTSGMKIVADVPSGRLPQSMRSSSGVGAAPPPPATAGQSSKTLGIRCEAMSPGLADATIARLRWASLSDPPGVAPSLTGSPS